MNNTYMELSDLLVKKAQALEEEDLYTLDEILNQEQVHVLKTRGFDQNLATFRSKTGYKGETLSELIAEMPEDEHRRFGELRDKLSRSLGYAKQVNDKCQRLAQVKVHGINRIRSEAAKPAPEQKPSRQDRPFSKNV